MDVLFVCTGNTCRSPLAEVLLRVLLDKRGIRGVNVASAGISASQGSPASAGSKSVLAGDEDLSGHEARQIDPEMIAQADMVLTMTTAHREALATRFPQWAKKIQTLGGYAWNQEREVPDPFGGDRKVYLEARTQIEEAVKIVAQKIVRCKDEDSFG